MIPTIHRFNSLHVKITRFQNVFCNEQWLDEDAYLDQTRLYYIEEGLGWLLHEGERILLEPGYVYLIPSHMHFAYGCSGMKKLYLHITVTNQSRTDLLSNIGKICRMPYKSEEREALLRCLASDDLFSMLELEQLILRRICCFARDCATPAVPLKNYPPLLSKAIAYIQNHPRISLTTKEISQDLFVSESALRKLFQTELGEPLGKYIDRYVFQQALDMLADPDITIGQISQSLGFCDQFYFSRRFKERYRQTPSQFRRQLNTHT